MKPAKTGKKDAIDTPTMNYDVPIATKGIPSDPASKTLRLNNVSPNVLPNVLPTGFDPATTKKRPGY